MIESVKSEKNVKYESDGIDVMLSVCVAVYGVEAYIEQCVRSLFGQTLRDGVEFIFVDDATPDRSIEIVEAVLEEFPMRKSQVKIIRHKHNQGIVLSRRDASAAACGRYMICCDPDDWVDLDLYEELCGKADETGADCVCCDYFSEFGEHDNVKKRLTDVDSTEEMLHSILSGSARGVLWNKLFRREIAQKVFASATEKFVRQEDLYKVIQIVNKCGKIVFCHGSCYHYRIRPGSICRSRMKLSIVHEVISELDILEKLLPGTEFAEDWNFRKRWQLLWILLHFVLPPSEYRKLWPEAKCGIMKDHRFSLSKRLAIRFSDWIYPFAFFCVGLLRSLSGSRKE